MNWGSAHSPCTRSMNSLLSSMTVRSAAKEVSNTLSKPMARESRANLARRGHPGSRPNISPIATRTAGATWATTILFRVVERLPDLFDLGFGGQGARRADARALAAVDALHLVEVLAEGRDHRGLGAPVREIDGAHGLDLGADADAIAAEDALVRVAHEGRRGIVDGGRPGRAFLKRTFVMPSRRARAWS